MESTSLTIGLFGIGTVGGGVIDLLKFHPTCRIKKVFVRNLNVIRDIPNGIQQVTKVVDIVMDPEINCIVEVMGGIDLAWAVIEAAIIQGKHIVTANKALIATYMQTLITLLQEHPTVQFHYEAAVCGGIPIISTLKRSFLPRTIQKIQGIFNGTTNYILTAMNNNKISFDNALKEAQIKGYAEADSSADIDGLDARAKLKILAKLAFGICISDNEDISCQGISKIRSIDFEFASMLGGTIKLLGYAERIENPKHLQDQPPNYTYSFRVSPVIILSTNSLANVSDVENGVRIDSEYLGTMYLSGLGAGRYPTANSVVTDIFYIQQHLTQGNPSIDTFNFNTEYSSSLIQKDYCAVFYIRINVKNETGIFYKLSEILTGNGVPIFSILRTPIYNNEDTPFAFITEKCNVSSVNKAVAEIIKRRHTDFYFVLDDPLCIEYFTTEK